MPSKGCLTLEHFVDFKRYPEERIQEGARLAGVEEVSRGGLGVKLPHGVELPARSRWTQAGHTGRIQQVLKGLNEDKPPFQPVSQALSKSVPPLTNSIPISLSTFGSPSCAKHEWG